MNEIVEMFDSCCPACGEGVLVLNDADFWECKACGLQGRTWVPGCLSVLNWKGTGAFRMPERTIPADALLVIPETEPGFLRKTE